MANGGSDRPGDAFEELDALRLLLDETLSYAGSSLSLYRDTASGGYFHLLPTIHLKDPGDFSKASTATCLSLMRAAGLGGPSTAEAQHLSESILQERHWESSGLKPDNPFTVAFLLEALKDLQHFGATLAIPQRRKVNRKLATLRAHFTNGGVSIEPYPATAFLTYKAVRALVVWGQFDEALRLEVGAWAQHALHEESVLVSSKANDADVFELAYAVLTLSQARELGDLTPPQRDVIAFAIDQFLESQHRDGTWPRSRPLFLYPDFGDAYCYDYELLVGLLADRQLRPLLMTRMPPLTRAAEALERQRFPLGARAYGWSSGHLRQVQSAESWSTASVFHYCFELQRLVADGMRRTLFEYVGERPPPIDAAVSGTPKAAIDRERFLDSRVVLPNGQGLSLTALLEERFLSPLVAEVAQLELGRAFSKRVPTSAILYGPPGTSKTELASLIAEALAWPLLKIDPSHLTRGGLDHLHAEAYRLFGMLSACERTVVLLDEFDELVREREGPNEVLSRFLTTAMLPKLTALSDRRRLVVLLATNHLESFDSAISRPGRFDMIVPVMPPTLDAKLAKWSGVQQSLDRLGIDIHHLANVRLAGDLDDLTFAEFRTISNDLASRESKDDFEQLASAAAATCTLRQILPGGDETVTWKTRLVDQQSKIRLPK